MPRRHLGAHIATLALLALLALACGTQTVDAAKLEQTIREGIEASTDMTVISVDCPVDRVFKLGDVFTCTAKTSDGKTLIVTVTNDQGGGNLKYEVTGIE